MSKLTRVDYTGVLELDAEKRCALFGADGANDEVGACYAVLDSGVLINVVELAEAQGNVGACLFTGELANEMRDQAPYVHRLDQTNRFAGNVITASDAPWHLWGKGGMILMSSHASRDAVQAHWRKFTRMLDVLGKGYYFRFWEPDMLLGFLEVCSDEELEGFFGGTLITRLMLPIAKGDTLVDLRLEDASEAVAKRSFPLRPEHFHAFSAVSWMRFELTSARSSSIASTTSSCSTGSRKTSCDRSPRSSSAGSRDGSPTEGSSSIFPMRLRTG